MSSSPLSSIDYYDILGVNKNVSENDLKKAYKKMAMKYHPDRNNGDKEAEKKFKDISKAYRILSDTEKRKIYDNFGVDDINMSDTFSGFNAQDLFSNIFNTQGMSSNIFNNFFSNESDKEEYKEINVEISLLESYTGCIKEIKTVINKKCLSCKGNGGNNPKNTYICKKCDGNGFLTTSQKIGSFQFANIQRACIYCNTEGYIPIPLEEICRKCNGICYNTTEETFLLNVEKGVLDNFKIKKPNSGNFNPKTKKQSTMIFNFIINNETGFTREGNNLIFTKNISLGSSICGIDFAIKHLNSEIIRIKYDKIIKPDTSLVISKNYGMPIFNTDKYGELIVRFNILYPSKIKEEYKYYLRKMLYVNINQKNCLEDKEKLKSELIKNLDVKVEDISKYNTFNSSTNNNSTTFNNNSTTFNNNSTTFNNNSPFDNINENHQECVTQ